MVGIFFTCSYSYVEKLLYTHGFMGNLIIASLLLLRLRNDWRRRLGCDAMRFAPSCQRRKSRGKDAGARTGYKVIGPAQRPAA